MCLILLAWRAHPRYPLVLLANRDEYLHRATAPMHHWDDPPGILAGRDLEAGGTWLGVAGDGRIAAVTNVREPGRNDPGRPSRGALVSDFLCSRAPAGDWLDSLAARAGQYNGFNLLVGDAGGLFHFNNRDGHITALTPGLHGISNATLDTPWPKVTGGLEELARRLDGPPEFEPRDLLPVLLDSRVPPDEDLPDTGVGSELERMLGSRLIQSEGYGTRSSTVVLVHGDGTRDVLEVAHPDGEHRRFRLP